MSHDVTARGGEAGELGGGPRPQHVVEARRVARKTPGFLDERSVVIDGEPDEQPGLRRQYVALTRAAPGLPVVRGPDAA